MTENLIYARKYKFLLVSTVSAFIGTLDASIVNVSLPTLARSLNVTVDLVAWVVLAYSLTITATLLLIGRLAVKKGYRFIYINGFIFFTLGSLLCALSGGIWQLTAARVVQGFGASFLMASGPALITRAFPVEERGRNMGIIGTVVGVGLMSGPPIGGFLISSLGWHSIFLINIPIGLFGIFYAARTLKIIAPDNPETRIDWIGGVFQGIGVILLLLFFNRVNDQTLDDYLLYGCLALSLALLAAFLWREKTAEHPLLGLSIFSYKQFSIAIGAMMVVFICSSSGMVLIPFYLEDVLKLNPLQVGLTLMTIPICIAFVAPVTGRISDAIGYRFLTTTGILIFIVGVLWTATLHVDSSRTDVILRLVVLGIGMGMFQAPNSSAMMSAVPKRLVGIASSILAITRNLGIGGGVAIASAIFTYEKSEYLRTMSQDQAFVKSFQTVVSIFGFVAIAAFIISIIRKNRVTEPN